MKKIILNKNPVLNCLKLIRNIHCGINETILLTELTHLDESFDLSFSIIYSIIIINEVVPR
jgi:hypothetical protein